MKVEAQQYLRADLIAALPDLQVNDLRHFQIPIEY